MKIPEEALRMAIKRMNAMDYKTPIEIAILQTATVINDHLNNNPKTKELIFQKIKEIEVANANQ